MRILGVLLLLYGAGSFVPSKYELQNKLFAPIESWQPWAGIVCAVAGLLLAAGGRRRPMKGG